MKILNLKNFIFIVLSLTFITTLKAETKISINKASQILSENNHIALRFTMPTTNILPNKKMIADGYRYADKWVDGRYTLHAAEDINTQNDCGREIYAIGNGVVRYSGNAGNAWKGVVLIQHKYNDNGETKEIVSQYAHIAPLDSIKAGDIINIGDKIGYISDQHLKGTCSDNPNNFKGVSNPISFDVNWSPHLHFEIRHDLYLEENTWLSEYDFQQNSSCSGNILYASLNCRVNAVNKAGFIDPLPFIKSHTTVPEDSFACNSNKLIYNENVIIPRNELDFVEIPSQAIESFLQQRNSILYGLNTSLYELDPKIKELGNQRFSEYETDWNLQELKNIKDYSPAEYIYYTSKENNLNPIITLAFLQKEQSLIEGKNFYNLDLQHILNRAVGYGMYDTADNKKYYSFLYQTAGLSWSFNDDIRVKKIKTVAEFIKDYASANDQRRVFNLYNSYRQYFIGIGYSPCANSTISNNKKITDKVFDYFENKLPSYFSPQQESKTDSSGFYYRNYSNGMYLKELNGELYYNVGSGDKKLSISIQEIYETKIKDTSVVKVTSISPASAKLGEQTTFTVQGSSLPSTLAFWIDACSNVTKLSGSSNTRVQFRCTPSYSTGSKNGVVKDKPNGTALKSFTLNVTQKATNPTVTSVSPSSAKLNEQTTFTVQGSKLPNTLALWIDACANMTKLSGNSNTRVQFRCTPSYSTGSKSGVVKDRPSGTALRSFTLNVTQKATNPTVTSVSPSSAKLNEQTTFTVQGSNLPSTLAFWIDACSNVTKLSGSSNTRVQFRCTPSYSTGSKSGVVKDRPSGTALRSFTLNVTGSTNTGSTSFKNKWRQTNLSIGGTSKWVIKPVGNGYSNLCNTANKCLHVEYGSLQLGTIQSGWQSAQWKFEPTGNGYNRIRNRWKSSYIHVEYSATPRAGTIESSWWSAQWKNTSN